MAENVRILKTTAMTFVVKLDPPGPFLINSLVDVADVVLRKGFFPLAKQLKINEL